MFKISGRKDLNPEFGGINQLFPCKFSHETKIPDFQFSDSQATHNNGISNNVPRGTRKISRLIHFIPQKLFTMKIQGRNDRDRKNGSLHGIKRVRIENIFYKSIATRHIQKLGLPTLNSILSFIQDRKVISFLKPKRTN